MSIVIGIDVGSSSTKIIGIEDGKRIKSPLSIKGNDPIAGIYGAMGKYMTEKCLQAEDIESIMLTGVGARDVKGPILDRPTECVDEFLANGLGARFDSGLDHMIVVSMGTGTSLVRVDGDDIKHIGGIGMGGGTLQGLCHLLFHTTDIEWLNNLGQDGRAEAVNLTIKDVCPQGIDGLFEDTTASLFGKAHLGNPSPKDIAASLIHMVLETIGSCAVMSQINNGFKDFVLIGSLTRLNVYCDYIFPTLERLYQVKFHIPKYAYYCTALGAALSHNYNQE